MLIFKTSFPTAKLVYFIVLFYSCDMLKGSFFMEGFSDCEMRPANGTRVGSSFRFSQPLRMTTVVWICAPCRLVEGFSPEDGENIFLRNVDTYRQVYTAPKFVRTLLSLREGRWTGLLFPNFVDRRKETFGFTLRVFYNGKFPLCSIPIKSARNEIRVL
jgi:hypothetical protein